MKLEDGWLIAEEGDPVIHHIPTTRTCKLDTPKPLGIVHHYTGGVGNDLARNLAERIRTYDRKVDRPASWHLIIAKSGEIFQSASLLRGTWHIGRNGTVGGKPWKNVNRVTIGIELENAGRLRRVGDRYYCHPYWKNPDADPSARVPNPKLMIDSSRAKRFPGVGVFETFTTAQEETAARLLSLCVGEFGWDKAACSHNHSDFDSPRKEDCGPAWNRDCLSKILGKVFPGVG